MAVWKARLPSTFCITWWMWPFSTVTEPKRRRWPSARVAVLGAPAPLRVDRPERDVGEDHDRLARRPAAQVVLQPGKLRLAEMAEAARPQVHDVVQADEVHAALVEAVPAALPRTLA